MTETEARDSSSSLPAVERDFDTCGFAPRLFRNENKSCVRKPLRRAPDRHLPTSSQLLRRDLQPHRRPRAKSTDIAHWRLLPATQDHSLRTDDTSRLTRRRLQACTPSPKSCGLPVPGSTTKGTPRAVV